jgi:hypothetical protein
MTAPDQEAGQTMAPHEHKQAPIIEDGEVAFSVDEQLQPLVQFLVDKGVMTFNSCQDNVGGTCWVEFALWDWMTITEVAFGEARDLYQFIEEQREVKLHAFDDGHPDDNDEEWIDGDTLIWSASVRFQKYLLPAFEELMRQALADRPLLHAEDDGGGSTP